MSYQAKAAQSKQNTVKEFGDLIAKYPIVGVVNLESLPAKQEQTIRAKLRDKVVIRMTKKRLMKRIFENANGKSGVNKLEEYMRGMPALLFTNENPFSLFKTIKQNQSPAPAKAGDIAPKDIVVPAGGTNFAPGPVIGELGALGIKSKVDGGKIAILEDTTVAKEGETISGELASMLTRLNIMPMSVGLDLVAVWENGDIMTRSVLDIDEDKFMADLEQAARWAFNLSVEAVYPTDVNRELLLGKAFREAKAVALEANFLADAVAEELVGKAERQANSVASAANYDASAPKNTGAAKEEPKAEEKPAEEKAEAPAEPAPEAPAESPSPTTEDKVEDIVQKTKDNDEGNAPSAQDVVENS